MHLENYIGKSVLVNMRAAFLTDNKIRLTNVGQAGFDECKKVGIYTYMAKVVAVDELGLWLENEAWEFLKPDGSPKSYTLHFLVLWRYVLSVGAFPDATPDPANPSLPMKVIGF